MKIASTTKISIPYSPAPTPPKTTSPMCMLNIGTRPPSGVSESCMQLTAPQLASVVTQANSADWKLPEANFLAFEVASGRVHAQLGEARVAGDFRVPQHQRAGQEQHEHRSPHGPAVALLFHHPAQVVGERTGDREDRQDLHKVAERRRVLKRVSRVGVEEAARRSCPAF